MTFNRATITLASIALASAVPAFAQANPFAPGTQVTDVKGGVVGTVTAVNGNVITVKTDKNEANLGKDSFTPHEGKLLFGMTQAELDAAVEKDKVAAEASLAVGSPVKGRAGAEVGIDGVLVEGDATRVAEIARQVAELPGKIVPVQSAADVNRDMLVHEVSVSINTAAAGGNASLMALGEG